MKTVTHLSNVVDLTVIEQLKAYYELQPISNTRYLENGKLFRNMKHSDYNIKDSKVYTLLHPIIERVVGSHQFTGGHYLDAHWPFTAHFDSVESFKQNAVATGFEDYRGLEIGCLIPLIGSPHAQTVFFDYFYSGQHVTDISKENLTGDCKNQIDLIDHHDSALLEIVLKMNIVAVCPWKLGDIILFDRAQLHCSSNFTKYISNKQCIVLWI